MGTLTSGLSNVALAAIIRHTDPDTLHLWAVDGPTLAYAIETQGRHPGEQAFVPNLPTPNGSGTAFLSDCGGGSWKPLKIGDSSQRTPAAKKNNSPNCRQHHQK